MSPAKKRSRKQRGAEESIRQEDAEEEEEFDASELINIGDFLKMAHS